MTVVESRRPRPFYSMSSYQCPWDEEKVQGERSPAAQPLSGGLCFRYKSMDAAEEVEITKLLTVHRNLQALTNDDGYSPRLTELSSSSKTSKEGGSKTGLLMGHKSWIPKTGLKIRLRRGLPRLKSIVLFRRSTNHKHERNRQAKPTPTSTKPMACGSTKDVIKPSTPTRNSPRHKRGPSSSTKSTTTTRKRALHQSNTSGSTWVSSILKPLPKIPDEYPFPVQRERQTSSVYSSLANESASPTLVDTNVASLSEPCLRPESTTVLLMQGENPFEGEGKQLSSDVDQAQEQEGNAHVHFRDQPSIVSPPAEFKPLYHHEDESGSTITIKPPPPLQPVRSTPDVGRNPPKDQELNTAYLALKRENTDLRNSITKLASLQNDIECRVPKQLAHLESENTSLRHALAQAETQRNALSASVSSLILSPTASQLSLPFSAPPTPTLAPSISARSTSASARSSPAPSTPARSTPPPPRASSVGGRSERSRLGAHQSSRRRHQLPQPPLTAEVTLPDVDKLLHPAAKDKYYSATDARLPEPHRLAEALSRQEDDLEKNREYMQRVRARVERAEEDMDAGIEEVRAAKRMLGVRTQRGMGAVV